ncbi:MAG: sugar transferase [Thermoguttaceae bacterium]|nr:sugar transferase [Thermoguttaceae bacterium]
MSTALTNIKTSSVSSITEDFREETILSTDEMPVEVEVIEPSAYFVWRFWFDRFVALILLIPGLPIMFAVSILLFLTSDGPILYKQRRVGKNGKIFTLMKFRSMIPDAEKKTGPVWTSVNDPRITKLGKLLRASHLDELPQIFNVLKGDMLLIGPRPERPEFTCHLSKAIPGYDNRSLIPPGVTGLAQINLPPDSDLESVRRKVTLDLEYIKTGSFKMDVQIFVTTFLRLLLLPGEFCKKVTGIYREVHVPDYMYRHVEDQSMFQTYTDKEKGEAKEEA